VVENPVSPFRSAKLQKIKHIHNTKSLYINTINLQNQHYTIKKQRLHPLFIPLLTKKSFNHFKSILKNRFTYRTHTSQKIGKSKIKLKF